MIVGRDACNMRVSRSCDAHTLWRDPMQHMISREAVNNHARLNRENERSDFAEDACLVDYDDDSDEPFIQLVTYLNGIRVVNDENGIIVNDDSVTFSTAGLDAAALVYNRVMDDYNGSDGRSIRDADSPWVVYNLADSDETVDECGSHPLIAIDLLREIIDPV